MRVCAIRQSPNLTGSRMKLFSLIWSSVTRQRKERNDLHRGQSGHPAVNIPQSGEHAFSIVRGGKTYFVLADSREAAETRLDQTLHQDSRFFVTIPLERLSAFMHGANLNREATTRKSP